MRETSVKYPFLTRDVKIYEQDNGHKIVLAYKEGGMVNVSSWVKTGSINENDKNNGISHFLFNLGRHDVHCRGRRTNGGEKVSYRICLLEIQQGTGWCILKNVSIKSRR